MHKFAFEFMRVRVMPIFISHGHPKHLIVLACGTQRHCGGGSGKIYLPIAQDCLAIKFIKLSKENISKCNNYAAYAKSMMTNVLQAPNGSFDCSTTYV